MGLEHGNWLDQNKPALAMRLSSLPWVADGVDESEQQATELLIGAARWYPEVFGTILEKPWANDSITQPETDAIFGFRWLARSAYGQVDDLLAMSWVQDEITEPEGRAVRYFYGVGLHVRPLANKLLEKSWVQDDITADEATVIQNLYWTARPQEEAMADEVLAASIDILGMPFLESVDPPDAQAVRSLQRLEHAGSARFLEIVSHPKIADGITDEEAKIVALLGGTYSYRPESGDMLLRGAGVNVEERTIELPLSGDVSLAVVRIRDQSTASMDYLEHSVRIIEEFMGVGLPVTYIALLYDDAVFPGAGGTNFGTHMAMQLLYDVEGGDWWDYNPFAIADGVAKYYWRGDNKDWIIAGAGLILASMSEYARVEPPIESTNYPCGAVKTIGELEAMDPEEFGTRGFNCNYYLGESLFLDLYNSLGEKTFRQGFRSLYLKSLAEDYSDDCEGTELGICHLVAAFKADVTDAQAAKVDEIVGRWYGPLP